MAFESWQCFAQHSLEDAQGPLWALATLMSFDGNLAVGNIDLIDVQGRVVAKMEGASLRRVSRDWVRGSWPDRCPIGATNWPGRPNR